ncbi:DUF58 domain-containing protein [Celerinatantimonas sp. YJH-8]|uniref:DUF58 domain-containing protein n=1 Tax=Celerinatantimonas sp. YJH-8 TaxID=3228714 RepID=UPI0038C1E4A8
MMFQIQRPSPVDLSLQQLIQCRFIPFQTFQRKNRQSTHQAGNWVSPHRGRGMEFDEVRRYQSGDDIRYIDWRVTARTGHPHSKLFHEERDRSVMISIDLTPSMFFGSGDKLKSMMACELAAIIGWDHVEQRQRIGLQILGEAIKVTPISQHPKTWLQSLDLLQHQYHLQLEHLQSETNTTQDFNELTHYAPTGADLHFISDFYHYSDPDFLQLTILAARHRVVLWQITDPFEFDLPQNAKGRLPVQNLRQSGWLVGQSKHFREQYRQAAQNRQQQIIEATQKVNLPFHPLSTQEDWHAYF